MKIGYFFAGVMFTYIMFFFFKEGVKDARKVEKDSKTSVEETRDFDMKHSEKSKSSDLNQSS